MHSKSFNKKRGVWIFRFQSRNGKWQSKWASKEYAEHQGGMAEEWFKGWFGAYQATENMGVQVVRDRKLTLRLMSSDWLAMQYKSLGIKPSTYKSLKGSVENWILDKEGFDHNSIEGLDIEKELNINCIMNWIDSMNTSLSSKLSHISCLKKMLGDIGAMNIPDYRNPFDAQLLKNHVRDVKKLRSKLGSPGIIAYEVIRYTILKCHQK